MNQRKHVGTILVLYPIFLFTSSWCGAAAQLRPVPMVFKVNTEIWIRFIGLRFTLKHREHRKCRKYKLSFVFLRFSYLSILNEPFRRGNAQIIHKRWACMGLYKIQSQAWQTSNTTSTKMQNMASQKSTSKLVYCKINLQSFWRRSILYCVGTVGIWTGGPALAREVFAPHYL